MVSTIFSHPRARGSVRPGEVGQSRHSRSERLSDFLGVEHDRLVEVPSDEAVISDTLVSASSVVPSGWVIDRSVIPVGEHPGIRHELIASDFRTRPCWSTMTLAGGVALTDRPGSVMVAGGSEPRPGGPAQAPPAFAGFRFPPDVIILAVRWHLRYAPSYRDVERAPGRARYRGGSRDSVPVGAADHSRADRRGPPLPERRGGAAGSSTRRTSRSPRCGGLCTGRSTSTARSSPFSSPAAGIPPRPGSSSPQP